MREIKAGEKTIRVRGNPLALLYYRQEFGSDLLGDMIKMQEMASDPSRFNALTFLQMAWAMAKAAEGFGVKFPEFGQWLDGMDEFDISDPEIMGPVLEEAQAGFFRHGADQAAKQQRLK